MRRSLGVITGLLLICALGSACGDDESSGGGGTTTTVSTTTTAPATPTDAETDPEGGEPDGGEPVDGLVAAGDELAVMGVAHDDVLNLRSAPGTDSDVVVTADPTANGLVASGEARSLSGAIWLEVTTDGATGWASASFLGFRGPTDDATSAILGTGDRPSAESMEALGEQVASGFATEEPASKVVESVEASDGDPGEVTFDVIGVGDDSVAGYRLHVFGTPDGDDYALRTVERTIFCIRGLSGELCT